MNNFKEDFNPVCLKISDYKTSTEYKNDYFLKNIVNTTEYYELQILKAYFTYGFLCIKHIFEASKQLSNDKQSEITYRKVNDWSSKELFEENRTRDIEWRKYSIPKAVQLLLINDLKKYGFSNTQIKEICKQVFYDKCDIQVENNKYNYRSFDFFASTFYKTGVNFSLLIDNNCNSYVLTNKDLAFNIVDGIDMTKPYLILPFSKYLSVFASYVFGRENEGVITEKLSAKEILPTPNEQKIIERVRDNEIQNITINRKSRNKSLIMKSTKIQDNVNLTDEELGELSRKPYTKTKMSNIKGDNYNLEIEETEKLD